MTLDKVYIDSTGACSRTDRPMSRSRAAARSKGSSCRDELRPRDVIIDRSAFDFGKLEPVSDTEHFLLADMPKPQLELKG
jgi:ATP-dependent DNA helicase PIF1